MEASTLKIARFRARLFMAELLLLSLKDPSKHYKKEYLDSSFSEKKTIPAAPRPSSKKESLKKAVEDRTITINYDCPPLTPLPVEERPKVKFVTDFIPKTTAATEERPKKHTTTKTKTATTTATKTTEEPVTDLNLEQPKRLKEAKKKLPIFEDYSKIMSSILQRRVTIISAATGSGKSTQVPQFILDHHNMRTDASALAPQIVVTQPRRIAALSLCERLKDERSFFGGGGNTISKNESPNAIGYSIRFDHAPPTSKEDGSIHFCTTGIALRRMMNPKETSKITHVILDEIHERDMNNDILLLVCKRLLENDDSIKLILMSASMKACPLIEYFSSFSPGVLLDLPGSSSTCHPVDIKFLDTGILPLLMGDPSLAPIPLVEASLLSMAWEGSITKEDLPANIQDQLKKLQASAFSDHTSATAAANNTDINTDINSDNSDNSDNNNNTDNTTTTTTATTTMMNPLIIPPSAPDLPYGIITALLFYLSKQQGGATTTTADTLKGNVLVFMPGLREARMLSEMMRPTVGGQQQQPNQQHYPFPEEMEILILTKSSTKEVMNECLAGGAPSGWRVIIATNVAESSITLPDIVHVIDAGRQKVQFAHSNPSLSRWHEPFEQLENCYIAKNNQIQRIGRAGRCRAGHYWAIYSENRTLVDSTPPEMLRLNFDHVTLQLKAAWGAGKVEDIYDQCLDRPSKQAISDSVKRCSRMLCLTAGKGESDVVVDVDHLTPVGLFLSSLPILPHIGRMLLLARRMGGLSLFKRTLRSCALLSKTDGSMFDVGRIEAGGASMANSKIKMSSFIKKLSSKLSVPYDDLSVQERVLEMWDELVGARGLSPNAAYDSLCDWIDSEVENNDVAGAGSAVFNDGSSSSRLWLSFTFLRDCQRVSNQLEQIFKRKFGSSFGADCCSSDASLYSLILMEGMYPLIGGRRRGTGRNNNSDIRAINSLTLLIRGNESSAVSLKAMTTFKGGNWISPLIKRDSAEYKDYHGSFPCYFMMEGIADYGNGLVVGRSMACDPLAALLVGREVEVGPDGCSLHVDGGIRISSSNIKDLLSLRQSWIHLRDVVFLGGDLNQQCNNLVGVPRVMMDNVITFLGDLNVMRNPIILE